MEDKKVIILVANIGCGKSTLTDKYQKQGYLIIARDQLRYSIGGGKYVFNPLLEPVIWATELYMYRKFLKLGVNIVIDEVGINKKMRNRYIKEAKKYKYEVECIELQKLTMKEAVDRRMRNPHQQPDRDLWENVWKKFDSIYQPPTLKEGFNKITNL